MLISPKSWLAKVVIALIFSFSGNVVPMIGELGNSRTRAFQICCFCLTLLINNTALKELIGLPDKQMRIH